MSRTGSVLLQMSGTNSTGGNFPVALMRDIISAAKRNQRKRKGGWLRGFKEIGQYLGGEQAINRRVISSLHQRFGLPLFYLPGTKIIMAMPYLLDAWILTYNAKLQMHLAFREKQAYKQSRDLLKRKEESLLIGDINERG